MDLTAHMCLLSKVKSVLHKSVSERIQSDRPFISETQYTRNGKRKVNPAEPDAEVSLNSSSKCDFSLCFTSSPVQLSIDISFIRKAYISMWKRLLNHNIAWISSLLCLPVSLLNDKYRAAATRWCGELFPLLQAQNVWGYPGDWTVNPVISEQLPYKLKFHCQQFYKFVYFYLYD